MAAGGGSGGGSENFIPVQPKIYPSTRPPGSSDSTYWKSFKKKAVSQQVAGVTCIDFCPEPPYDFAVTSSTRVSIYDGESCELKKTISKFKDVAYSGVFRSDGQIIAAGGETGIIQVFDVNSKMVLRQLKSHGRPVRLVRYAPQDKLHLLSGSDDSMVKWWDVTTQEELLNLEGHKDYVRCGAASPSSNDIWATGSYDHTVRLWDLRNSKTILHLKHGKPLEDVLFFPSGGLLATAGGNIVKVWDILGGGRLIHMMESHQKTVMSMCVSKVVRSGQASHDAPSRLVTASLDGYMKAFDLNSFRVTHSAKYPAPVLSMGISPSCRTMAIGTSSGQLFIRQRKKQLDKQKPSYSSSILGSQGDDPQGESKPPVLRPNQFRYFLRGQSEKASEGDYHVKRQKKVNLQKYDRLLRKFRHTDALIYALKTANPKKIIAVMEELVARRMLMKSVVNLNGEDFELLIKFLCKYTAVPMYSRFLVALTDKVLDTRVEDLGNSETLKQQIGFLRSKVIEEIRVQQSMQELQGIIEPLIRASVQ
uniref:U3 small nucleolar RNA-associated protein 15 C-terminal domain-containing protein n=1 Tax=Araucaria cunninghamii TaxID=56994 RepID=A0A0D6RAL4_ARACU